MRCTKCEFENPVGMKPCGLCMDTGDLKYAKATLDELSVQKAEII